MSSSRLAAMIEPFRTRNFRFQWLADLVVSWAFEMETLVLGWYIFTETGSVLLLTIFGSLLFVGTLLSPLFGVVADRVGHRNLLCFMRTAYALLAIVLTCAIFADLLVPEFALAVAFLAGLVRPSDMGMRSALVTEIVPPAYLVSAMAVSRTTFDSARIVGALVGSGLFAAVGIALTYIVILSLYVAGLLLTLCITSQVREDGSQRQKATSPWRDLREGVSYIWTNKHLQAAMWLALLVNLTAFPLTIGLLPYVAKELYGTDQTGLGYLLASFSAGALLGSLSLSMIGHKARSARMMIIFSIAWHSCLLLFAFSDDRWIGMAFLATAGLAQSLCMLPLVIMLMRTCDPAFRGRVMGVRMLAIYSLPIGLVISGTLIEALGFRFAMALYMMTGIIFTALIGLRWWSEIWPAEARGNTVLKVEVAQTMDNQNKSSETGRLRDREVRFDNGATGENVEIPSASPLNYHQVISNPDAMPLTTVDGKLFLPTNSNTAEPLPLVMIVPGSLGVAPSHLGHAETLNNEGFATFVLDSFGERGVTSTVAKQTQFSFAASAYDVLAAFKVLAARPDIDETRIGAQGHSRGGSAVLTAATRRFADAVIGAGNGLCAVLPAYPWSGHQFLDPRVGHSEVRVLMGDADEWCSPMQVQGHCQAIRLTGGTASMRLFKGAHHSFDRGTKVIHIPEASVSPAAPTTYLADDGAFIHPLEDAPNSELVDRDVMVYSLKAGYGNKGAHLGSQDGEADVFREDMVAFWRRVMSR